MTRGKRVALIALVVLGILVVGWGVVAAAVWKTGGLVTVSVDEGPGGVQVYLPVPMALVDVATVAVPSVTAHGLDRHLHGGGVHLDADFGEWAPAVRGMLEALAEMPDATLVEIEDDSTHVVVRKEGRDLKIAVEDEEITVRVSLPARSVARTVSRILS